MSIPSYPTYQQTNFPWTRTSPAHWRVMPFKRCVEIMNGADHKHLLAEEGYPVFGSGGVFAYATDYLYDGESVLIGRKGTIDRPRYVCGRFWTVDTMFWTKMLPAVVGRFIYYLATSFPFEYYATDTALPSMAKEDLEGHLVAVPPIDEQASIAAFLDSETRRIDELVEEQRRLIALLDEKRHAVISHAVTKGLNPDAPMKSSGVEWLGAVPAHWRISRLKDIALEMCDGPFGSGLKSEHYSESGVRVIRLGNIRQNHFDANVEAYVRLDYFEANFVRHSVSAGDLLVAGLGDESSSVGRACVAPEGIEPAMVKADCFRFKLNSQLACAEFVALQLGVSSAYDGGVLATGSTRSRVPLSATATRRCALPSLAEQLRVVNDARASVSDISQLVAASNHAIALLLERRAALVTAAVTGQIDVRALAPIEAP